MKRVLLIEDSMGDQELIKRAIRKSGFDIDVMLSDNGEHALEVLNITKKGTKQNLPQIVMLDLKIPKLSGKEVLKEIRLNSKTKMLPVVVFTSSREESDLRECYLLGANSFIRKPVNADDFNKAVDLIISYWFQLNELP
ncbi:MAG: response regulator [Bacteroidetes bacterium]|jgi:two-component system, response regulator|nr:response regulator [Bacteroidota bacterium]MBT5529454.1 response regulator [Cytophagia bacterium]MBT3421295.1 response regulator [Bacteroidota bacterium]MBT3933766.1 response regulator [Bacteroidota bacterium]MBT4726873.1 response regulator [Bacteroidota bacterium]